MTAGGAMSKSDAFEAISSRTGRRAGTVAANYYRIARKRGVALEPRVRRGPALAPSSIKRARWGESEEKAWAAAAAMRFMPQCRHGCLHK